MIFNDRETAAVLAGLRSLQLSLISHKLQVGSTIDNIFNNCDTLNPLNAHEIDLLCEKINEDEAVAEALRCPHCNSTDLKDELSPDDARNYTCRSCGWAVTVGAVEPDRS